MRALRVMKGPAEGKSFEPGNVTLFLGRAAKNDIQINDDTVSRMHLKIFRIETAGTLIAYAIENAELSFRMSLIADLCAPRQ
jgi:pSer/pThr/pTyr-binding forkhead associated (FHA) protein